MWFGTDKAVSFRWTWCKCALIGGGVFGVGSSLTLLTVCKGKKTSRWHGDTKDGSLLLLEPVKMEPQGCQLGWTSNKSHEEWNSLRRGQELGVKLSEVQRTLSLRPWQLDSELGPGPRPDGKLESENPGQTAHLPHGGTPEIKTFENPWLQNNNKLPTDGMSHGSRVRVKHLQTQSWDPALLGWAGRRGSRPRWRRRSPGGTPAVHDLLLRTGTACKAHRGFPGPNKPKCPG